jgi:four helix bundle protein
MGGIKEFYDLDVWKIGHDLVMDIYRVTTTFPQEEKYGLISQIQRAASSVTANIAEGFSRYHYRDKIRFY